MTKFNMVKTYIIDVCFIVVKNEEMIFDISNLVVFSQDRL